MSSADPPRLRKQRIKLLDAQKKESAMKGKCLCGQVEYEVTGKISNIYQCSCSICQKVTGTSKTSSLITGANDVRWIRGKDKISSYTKENGFRTDFCSNCGSPVPNKMNIGDYMCIPAGSIEDVVDREIVAHIFTESKASWDNTAENCKIFSGGPENIEEFMKVLQKK